MQVRRFIFLLIPVILLSSIPIQAARQQLAVRTEYGAIDDQNYDQPFSTMAIFVGWCRNFDRFGQDVRDIQRLYRVEDGEKKEVKVTWIGDLMINKEGREIVCVDDRAMHPQAVADAKDDVISVEGWRTSGESYNLNMNDTLNRHIIIVEKMEVLNHKPEQE